MNNTLRLATILALLISMAYACTNMFGGYNNPSDPKNFGTTTSKIPITMIEVPQRFETVIADDLINVPAAPFYIQFTEFSRGHYHELMNTNLSDIYENLNLPLEEISWFDALYICNALSIKEGFTPVYAINGEIDPRTWKALLNNAEAVDILLSPTVNQSANGYRLPYRNEWLHAATAGSFSLYAGSSDDNVVAWTFNNTYGAKGIAQKPGNALGIYDMSGNVAEWCFDGPDDDPMLRFAMGGGHNSAPIKLRSDEHRQENARSLVAGIGFRLARSIGEVSPSPSPSPVHTPTPTAIPGEAPFAASSGIRPSDNCTIYIWNSNGLGSKIEPVDNTIMRFTLGTGLAWDGFSFERPAPLKPFTTSRIKKITLAIRGSVIDPGTNIRIFLNTGSNEFPNTGSNNLINYGINSIDTASWKFVTINLSTYVLTDLTNAISFAVTTNLGGYIEIKDITYWDANDQQINIIPE
jgi:hypothetical protein